MYNLPEMRGCFFMRKVLFVLVLSLFYLTGIAYAETTEKEIILKVGEDEAKIGGQNVKLAAPAKVVSGSTLVPLRFISEAFGSKVDWDSKNQTAIIRLVDLTVKVPIGKKTAYVNDIEVPLQVPAQVTDGNTYVPLRFIGEILGSEIKWNNITQEVTFKKHSYENKYLHFNLTLPSGWAVREETKELVSLNFAGIGICEIRPFEKSQDITEPNLIVTVNNVYENLLSDKNITNLQHVPLSENISAFYFECNGYADLLALKLTKRGIYVVHGESPQELASDAFLYDIELMVNSLLTDELESK